VVEPVGAGKQGQVLDLVLQLDLFERERIADHHVEGVIWQTGVFKRLNENFGIWIEHGGKRPAEGILLDPEEFGLMKKLVGNAGKEVADSHARFEDAPASEAKAVCRRPHLVNDLDGCVVGIEGRFLDGIDFVLGEDLGQAIALLIVAVTLIPQLAQSAEVDVLRDAILFVGGRNALLGLDGLEQLKDVEVVLYARLRPALGDMRGHIIIEAEIAAVAERIGRKNRFGCCGFGGVVGGDTKVQLGGFGIAFEYQFSSDSSGG